MPLHQQSQLFVSQLAAQGRPAWQDQPLDQSRKLFDGLKGLFGAGPELVSVEDRSVGGIPTRIYRPSLEPELPVVMYFHGGGWVLGNLDSHDAVCRRLASESGFVVIAVDYRLAPEHKYPAAVDDCFLATQSVAENASEYKVDGRQIMLAGDSAGGNLCMAVSLRARDDGLAIRYQVLIYPVVEPNFDTNSYNAFATGHGLTRETMQWFWREYLEGSDTDPTLAHFQDASLKGLPQTHVITAEYDVLRDEGKRLVERLRQANVPTTYRCYEGMLHGFVHFAGFFDDGVKASEDIGSLLREQA